MLLSGILIAWILSLYTPSERNSQVQQNVNVRTETSSTAESTQEISTQTDQDNSESGVEPMNSFKLLIQAVESTRQPIWASLQILFLITLILATIFYFAEKSVQPNIYNYKRSLLWAFTLYIGDPGRIGGEGPKTGIGKTVASLIGVVGILIIAVPTGLIAAGFEHAYEENEQNLRLKTLSERVEKAFRREQDHFTMYRHIARYIELGTLQAKQSLSEQDIMDVVRFDNHFRLRNLATAETEGKHTIDQLVVEMYPLNTSYGFKIDRGSNVTIACPSSSSEAGIGNFGYYLALIGGFNYISKELEPEQDEFISYYIIDDKEKPDQRKQYLADLQKLSQGKDNWTIFLISSERESDYTFHFITKTEEIGEREFTVLDMNRFQKLYQHIGDSIDSKFKLKSELNTEYKPVKDTNSSVILGGGKTTNMFTIRAASEFVVWDQRYLSVCKELASIINANIVRKPNPAKEERLKEKGRGFVF